MQKNIINFLHKLFCKKLIQCNEPSQEYCVNYEQFCMCTYYRSWTIGEKIWNLQKPKQEVHAHLTNDLTLWFMLLHAYSTCSCPTVRTIIKPNNKHLTSCNNFCINGLIVSNAMHMVFVSIMTTVPKHPIFTQV